MLRKTAVTAELRKTVIALVSTLLILLTSGIPAPDSSEVTFVQGTIEGLADDEYSLSYSVSSKPEEASLFFSPHTGKFSLALKRLTRNSDSVQLTLRATGSSTPLFNCTAALSEQNTVWVLINRNSAGSFSCSAGSTLMQRIRTTGNLTVSLFDLGPNAPDIQLVRDQRLRTYQVIGDPKTHGRFIANRTLHNQNLGSLDRKQLSFSDDGTVRYVESGLVAGRISFLSDFLASKPAVFIKRRLRGSSRKDILQTVVIDNSAGSKVTKSAHDQILRAAIKNYSLSKILTFDESGLVTKSGYKGRRSSLSAKREIVGLVDWINYPTEDPTPPSNSIASPTAATVATVAAPNSTNTTTPSGTSTSPTLTPASIKTSFATATPVAPSISTATPSIPATPVPSVTATPTNTPRATESSSFVTEPMIKAGFSSTCALKSNGLVYCWGRNAAGQLGLGDFELRKSPTRVPNLVDVIKIDLSWNHACAVTVGGKVLCWGENGNGQIGNDSIANSHASPQEVVGIEHATDVSVGMTHSCATLVGGEIQCWGSNEFGNLGDGLRTPRRKPAPVLGLPRKEISQIVSGVTFSCALFKDGEGRCWGRKVFGPFNNMDSMGAADVINAFKNVRHVAAGFDHVCVVYNEGHSRCLGYEGMPTDRDIFPLGSDSLDAKKMAVTGQITGESRQCTMLKNGDVRCRGDNLNGELGIGRRTKNKVTPAVTVMGLKGALDIDLGYHHSCAIFPEGKVKCWGANPDGGLGQGLRDFEVNPVVNPALASATDLSGATHVCGKFSDGSGRCWGANSRGQIGDGTLGDSYSPKLVLPRVQSIAAGGVHTCAILSDKTTVQCWGDNSYAQIGKDPLQTSFSTTPLTVLGLPSDKTFEEIVAGDGHTCLRSSDGLVFCWGMNNFRQLGNSDAQISYIPLKTNAFPRKVNGEFNSVVSMSAGHQHTCALLSDRSVACWGKNQIGELGTGVAGSVLVSSSRPLPLKGFGPGERAVAQLEVGYHHSCIIPVKIEGEVPHVSCWGWVPRLPGPLEWPNQTTEIIKLSQELGDASNLTLALTSESICARSQSGSLKCVGGRLPTSETGTKKVVTAGLMTCFEKADDALYCIGYNAEGQFGIGYSGSAIEPLEIGFRWDSK